MAKKQLFGIIICCTFATSGWAETTSPSLIVTPAQPKWSELTVAQKIVLAPLGDDWDSFENFRQKKWLGIASRFPGMMLEEQRRIQKQMQVWGKLTPEERQLARENFKAAKELPAEKKQKLRQKWEEYANLPPEEKDRLKQLAANNPPSGPISKTILPAVTATSSGAALPSVFPLVETATPAALPVPLPVPLLAPPPTPVAPSPKP